MADSQPPTIVEGATTGDIDDEIPVTAKSAEDRKAAAALSSLDAPQDDETRPAKDVDQEAVRKAMDRLAGTGGSGDIVKKDNEKKVVKKIVKVDPADVTLLVCLLPLRTRKTNICMSPCTQQSIHSIQRLSKNLNSQNQKQPNS
ncbi:hypothetical protein D0Z07_8596 [Hyphodiscus hymeniophilus]|uniref:Nascent polypeptide-associated complex subunit alpha-like UBA domain-containing protein n=1 Tax=Hyphodiscus hymeniophilus TaxID=353542 RepID=A0A9P6SMV0_9HELO|nr:hypothetical protein D0Z07_8596 [Hyphodiscus hymeniophilus]